ncbi:hypothetical protein C0J52_19883 [Blattella germanica]|nr:hypothetical protein C0J52_19883 [Blattella germanica]
MMIRLRTRLRFGCVLTRRQLAAHALSLRPPLPQVMSAIQCISRRSVVVRQHTSPLRSFVNKVHVYV